MSLYRISIAVVVAGTIMSASPALPTESELHIGKFSQEDLTSWKGQSVFGAKKSTYSIVQDNSKTVLMGKSTNSASGLLNKIEIDPRTHPIIKWSWKIEHTVKKGNERIKDGHDFAARLYVVFPRGFFSRTRAIEYVWGNVMHKGDTLRSPYSNNAAMIAVDAGDELAGNWTFHKRNIAEDYRAVFGEEAPKVGAIAIMTDSDNTHESSVGYFGDITVLPAVKEDEQITRGSKHKDYSTREQPLKETKPKEQPKGNGLQSPPSPPAIPQTVTPS